jgi:U32 family peptidase
MVAKKKPIGKITHYFNKISVAVVKLDSALKEADAITIEGNTTNIKQIVASIQVDGKQVKTAKKGNEVGMKVSDRVRKGDNVFKA